jgi:hypothetical protein
MRGGLQPYICVEWVNVNFAGANMLTDDIQRPEIVRAGALT